jgi:hypothetical protein
VSHEIRLGLQPLLVGEATQYQLNALSVQHNIDCVESRRRAGRNVVRPSQSRFSGQGPDNPFLDALIELSGHYESCMVERAEQSSEQKRKAGG